MDRFEHLGFLFQYGDKGSEGNSLSQSSPFFANSDPDMPAVPVPASQVHDWLLQNIASALEYIAERTSSKENGPVSVSDQDVAMTDASTVPVIRSQQVLGVQVSLKGFLNRHMRSMRLTLKVPPLRYGPYLSFSSVCVRVCIYI